MRDPDSTVLRDRRVIAIFCKTMMQLRNRCFAIMKHLWVMNGLWHACRK